MQTLLAHYRDATKASHESLDAAFGSLDLARRDDYARFLTGHAMGMAPLFESFRSFVVDALGQRCPDYPAMLRADLGALGIAMSDLPSVTLPAAISPEAAGYVVSGSRLGLTMIARNGYWGRANDLPSAYMDDESGLAIWKQAAARLKLDTPDEVRALRERTAAVAVFDTFRAAFAASAAPTAA